MGRRKKINSVNSEENNIEVKMSQEAVLDNLQTEVDLARAELEKTRAQIEEKRRELESTAKREIDYKEAQIINKQINTIVQNKALSETILKQKKYDSEMVTGKFINRRAPGNPAKLTYMKYADDPVKWYDLQDNKVYTLPRGFADQINEHYHTPRFVQKPGEMDPNRPSSSIHEVDTSNKKYAFVPVSF